MTSLAQIREILTEELGEPRCGICGSTERVVIDHDHTTGIVRGWLCPSCNQREGRGAQRPEMLRWRSEPPAAPLSLIHPSHRLPDVEAACSCCGQTWWVRPGPDGCSNDWAVPKHDCPGGGWVEPYWMTGPFPLNIGFLLGSLMPSGLASVAQDRCWIDARLLYRAKPHTHLGAAEMGCACRPPGYEEGFHVVGWPRGDKGGPR